MLLDNHPCCTFRLPSTRLHLEFIGTELSRMSLIIRLYTSEFTEVYPCTLTTCATFCLMPPRANTKWQTPPHQIYSRKLTLPFPNSSNAVPKIGYLIHPPQSGRLSHRHASHSIRSSIGNNPQASLLYQWYHEPTSLIESTGNDFNDSRVQAMRFCQISQPRRTNDRSTGNGKFSSRPRGTLKCAWNTSRLSPKPECPAERSEPHPNPS